jgi:hypothetical protein
LEQSPENCAEDVDKILVPLYSPPKNKSSEENQPLAQDQPFGVDESDYRDIAIDPDQSNSGSIALFIALFIALHSQTIVILQLIRVILDQLHCLLMNVWKFEPRLEITATTFKPIELSLSNNSKSFFLTFSLSQLPLTR